MVWVIRIAAIVVGAFLILMSKAFDGTPAFLLRVVLGPGLVFFVWFVWRRTRLQQRAR